MSILTHIVAAEEDEISAVGASAQPVDEWSGIERRGIDTGKVATLHCLLCGESLSDALYLYEPVYATDEGVVVLRLADQVLEKLAELDEEAVERVGEELAATEEFEQENWPMEEVIAFVQELSDLARLADSQGQCLLVWMHPLLT